jgi:glucose/arabinose dehydrogenase
MNELLGKILRLDVNQEPIYSIPPENPFAKDESARPEIWSYGLRNPWRFSFDRLTGDLWIADVGQSRAEEINMQPFNSSGGENYGWRCYEGTEEFNTDDCGARESYNFPVYEYVHGDAECTVIGGYVYRGNEDSEYYGRYFYADFCSDRIWSLLNNSGGWTGELFGHFPGNGFSSFGEDSKGNIYIAGLASGIIYKLRL